VVETMVPVRGDAAAEPGDDVILRLEDVVGGYGATAVLHGTTFSVRRGALTTVIGPNGAGKSTAIKAIFGIVRVRSGAIWYEGEDIVGLTQVELLHRGISFVPQGRNVFPRLSVRTNLELGGVSLGNKRLTRERIEGIVFELFPVLRAKADRQVSTLSGGEQKMLEIGRAMLLQPRLMLIDEPSVGLSPILVSQVFGLMQQLRDRGTTVLMIEQNAKSALGVSDYGVVLQQGRVGLSGTADEVLNHPEIGPLFLGGAVRDLGPTAG
jgi:branched-chain amino acid transport system ATP-binding protein